MKHITCFALTGILLALGSPARAQDSAPTNSIFGMFAVRQRAEQVENKVLALYAQKRYAELELGLKDLIQADEMPGQTADYCYNLACVQALQGKTTEALDSLGHAVVAGYSNHAGMEADGDLASIRKESKFRELVAQAKKNATKQSQLTYRQGALTLAINPTQSLRAEPFAPDAVTSNGTVTVSEANCLWMPNPGLLLVVHRFDGADPRKDASIIEGHGAVGELLRGWQKEGTAAGLWGVIYDNHDRGHSNLNTAEFPQLTRLIFSDAAKKLSLDNGGQVHFLHTAERTKDWPRGCITFGNTSEAMVQSPFWRSLPRRILVEPQLVAVVVAQYLGNQIACYPEHQDHDPGHNGQSGNGDVFPANTPYFVISQGSSGSDQPFLQAIACTLAAFQPATRLALEEKGLIAPTVQMILRLSNKNVAKPEDYLTPQAHPTVLDAGQLDVEKMVRTAHAMNAAEIPGLAALTVKEETIGRPGTDYFSPLPENLFDTPFAIARVARSLDSERRLVISAEASRDPNGRPLTFHWVLLRGDSSTIRITPLNKAGTVAEIIIPHQTRRPIWPGSPLESSRVDIGVFTHNGVHYSAPSFVSIQYLENETRVYDGKRLLSVEYKSAERGGYYVDPFLEYAKDWKDEYHYDDQGHRLGWMRTLPDGTHADYTAEGALIQSRDAQGRAKEARLVRYNLTPATEKTIPTLVPVPAAETITYDYTSDQDRTGKIRLTPAVTQK